MEQFTIEKNKEDIQIVKDAILTQEVIEWKEMKYKLKKELPGLNIGSVFTLNEKTGYYTHNNWSFEKDNVENMPDWFEEVK